MTMVSTGISIRKRLSGSDLSRFYTFIEQIIQSDTCQGVYACVEGYTEVVTGWSEVELSLEERVERLLQVSTPQPVHTKHGKYIHKYIY